MKKFKNIFSIWLILCISICSLSLSSLLLLPKANALNVEAIPVMSVRKYDNEDVEAGFGFFSHWTFYKNNSGFYFDLAYRGTIVAPDITVGYGIRSQSKTYLEAGAGIRYYVFGGLGLSLLTSIGHNLTTKTYISLPIVYHTNGGLFYVPHIGYRF